MWVIAIIIYFAILPFVWRRAYKAEKSEKLYVKSASAGSAIGTFTLIWAVIIFVLNKIGLYDPSTSLTSFSTPLWVTKSLEFYLANKWLSLVLAGAVFIYPLVFQKGLKDEKGNWLPWKVRLFIIGVIIIVFGIGILVVQKRGLL